MSFQANKIWRLWFPFSILAIIVLTAGWILAGVVYPSNVQGTDLISTPQNTPTNTVLPTAIPPTSTIQSTPTATSTNLLPTETPFVNCTYSIYFWSTNTDTWRIENILLGNQSYTKIEALEIMTKSEPSPIERLMGQFFTALLNTLNGAESTEVDPIMVDARDWLILHSNGVNLSESELIEVEAFTNDLEEYNLGSIGPGPCQDEPVTPTPSFTFTPSATATSTPGTLAPFFSPTPTKGSGGRPNPTNTKPPVQPTNTPQPKPTNTPFPTPTSVLPPTDAPTLPPPTNVPTQPPPTSPPPTSPPPTDPPPTDSPPPTSGP